MGININDLLDKIDLTTLAEKAGAKDMRQVGGREWRGSCPFHSGTSKTAFVVHEEDDPPRWYCYRCEKGGDAIGLVMEWQTLDFEGAIEFLAELANIKLEDSGWKQNGAVEYKEQRARRDVLTLAARYYAEQLWSEKGKDALAYVRGRGFSDEALRQAGWGYSDGGKGLYQYLQAKNADLTLAHTMGLVRADTTDFTANANGLEAAPAGYLIYPHSRTTGSRKKCAECDTLTWHEGDVCLRHTQTLRQFAGVNYLSARAVERFDDQGKIIPRKNPKDKSRNIVGNRQVYWALAPGDHGLVIVEGQADAESLRQLGFSALALCGLGGLPEADLVRVKKREVVYLALDSESDVDEKLDAKNGKLVKTAGQIGPLTICLPHLPGGHKDFNDWLKGGADPDEVKTHLKGGETWLEKRIQHAKTCPPNEVEERMIELGGLLAALPEGTRPRYYKLAMNKLDLTRRELQEMVTLARSQNGRNGNNHILSSERDGQLCFLGEPLGNFTAHISHELTVDDGMNPPIVRYTLSGSLANGEPLCPVTVDAEEFPDLVWIHRYWGARPILHVPRGRFFLVTRAIQEVSLDQMTRDRVYTHTGWATVDNERSFLTASGRITAHGHDTNVRVDLGSNNSQYYNLPVPPSGDALLEAVKSSLAFLDLGPRRVTAPIWAAIYAAPLTEILPLYTLLWIYGPTQSGKSTVAHLALTHFGTGFIQGRQYHAPIDWMSTVTAIEGALFRAKDTPIIIDDFAPQFSSAAESREMHKKAHVTVRSVGNRAARSRSQTDLTDRLTRIPRGVVFSTAELPLVGESTVGRMIYIPIDRGDILPLDGEPMREALNQAQAHAQEGLYAGAMAAYVQWLAANWQRVAEQFPEMANAASKWARESSVSNLQNRLPDYFGVLHAAQTLALRAFQEMGMISGQDAKQQAETNRQALLEILSSQAEKIAAESPVRKFCDALGSLLERGKVYLAPRKQTVVYTPPLNAEKIGWYDPDNADAIYLIDAACLGHVRQFWANLGENFDSSLDALRRQFAQVGGLLLERGDGYNLLASKWIEGKTRRVLAINGKKVNELYGATLKNEESSSLPYDPTGENDA